MRTEKKFSRKNDEWEFLPVKKNGVAKCLAYTPPQYRINKAGCYIELYAYDPDTGKMSEETILRI